MREPTRRILAKLERDGEARFAADFLEKFLRDICDADAQIVLDISVENGMVVVRKEKDS